MLSDLKSGDTLWAISEREYGKGKGDKYDVIFQANRPMLTHPDKIYPARSCASRRRDDGFFDPSQAARDAGVF